MKLILSICFLVSFALHAQVENNFRGSGNLVIGKIDTIWSNKLGEARILNIYLPPSYNLKTDSVIYCPVIYLLDGSYDEDFIHVAGLVQYANFSWINWLPESIVVGIANVDRQRDFTYPTTVEKDKKDFPTTGGSKQFIYFIEEEIFPYIKSHYRVTDSKMIIGQSLGGLLATEILVKYPTMFDDYVIVSPSLWWDNESLLKSVDGFSKNISKTKRVYLAVGNEEKIMVDDAKKLHELIVKNTNNVIQLNYEYFNDLDHATILHQAVYNAFRNFSKRKK